VSLYVHTHVKEDDISLYGFATELERDLFRPLLGVKGVGPKLALAVLSHLSAPELVQALAHEDTARLNQVSGIGRKTAQQIVLELSEKAREWPTVPVVPRGAAEQDLVEALLQLGYRGGEARDAVSAIRAQAPNASLEESLRLCLKQLARR
jgi:Holliday junction DNA helicase RuvA